MATKYNNFDGTDEFTIIGRPFDIFDIRIGDWEPYINGRQPLDERWD